jgi:hypothetical protein
MTGGQRLQRLRAANLAAVDGDRGIESHVLRLERRDAHAAAVQDAAQGGDQGRFCRRRKCSPESSGWGCGARSS